jgi:hypothetical protein
VLGLHLEQSGQQLRLVYPHTGRWLLTPQERAEQEAHARRQAEGRAEQAEAALQVARAEVERLRRQLAARRGGANEEQ